MNQYLMKMKKLILCVIVLILLVAIVLLGSCKKEQTTLEKNSTTQVLFNKVRMTLDTSPSHTLMGSWYKINGVQTDIPMYSTSFEYRQMLKAGTIIQLHLKMDNVSPPAAYFKAEFYLNDAPDTAFTQDFNSPSHIDIYYTVK